MEQIKLLNTKKKNDSITFRLILLKIATYLADIL